MTRPTRCKVPHPTYSSYTCQKEAGHAGDHVGRRGRVSRHWKPYLSHFHALTRDLIG